MSVDPFNGGGTAMTLLLTTPHDDREQRRLEGVRRRATVNTAGIAHRLGASAGDTRDVLEALGLVEPQSVSKPSGRHRGQLGGSNPSTAVSGGKQAGSRGRSTDEKGRWTPKERENPELCSKQLHPWTPDNQIHRSDRGVSCRACANLSRQVRRAKARERAKAEKSETFTGEEVA